MDKPDTRWLYPDDKRKILEESLRLKKRKERKVREEIMRVPEGLKTLEIQNAPGLIMYELGKVATSIELVVREKFVEGPVSLSECSLGVGVLRDKKKTSALSVDTDKLEPNAFFFSAPPSTKEEAKIRQDLYVKIWQLVARDITNQPKSEEFEQFLEKVENIKLEREFDEVYLEKIVASFKQIVMMKLWKDPELERLL